MNRVFRVVWSRALKLWVVASELAPTKGKAGRSVSRLKHPAVRGVSGSAWPLRLGILTALMATGATVHAADRFWDPNGTGVGLGGAGTWDLSSLLWSPNGDGVSGPYATWNNTTFDDATFGGATAGVVTLGTPLNVHDLTFQITGYTLTGGTLTLGGTAPTISAGTTTAMTTTINSVIAGTAGLAKTGAGVLVLNGSNTFSGGVDVEAGSLTVGSDAALGAAGNGVTLATGTILTSANPLSATRTITLAGNATVGGAGAGAPLYTGPGGLTIFAGVAMANTANDYQGPTFFTQDHDHRFASIADLGVASTLGAPTTEANGLITFLPSGSSEETATYTGSGDSSNRNWLLQARFYSSAKLINAGTGTLTLTGNIAQVYLNPGFSTPTFGFNAQTADIDLQGVISSDANKTVAAYSGGGIQRSITLGAANTYTGDTTIDDVTVRANGLADAGATSSFGAGTAISVTDGAMSYIGAVTAESNRPWTIDNGSLLNDGGSTLTLTGSALVTDDLTLGGGYTGTNEYAGVISGAGNLVSNGSGTWLVSGTNTYTGTTTVNGGTLLAGSAQAFNAANALIVNGGSFDLGGFDTTFVSLAGTGGSVALGGNTLTVNGADDTSYGGDIAGGGGLVKRGGSTLTLTGSNTYTGPTTTGGGTLKLDFSAAGAPANNIISASSTLVMEGGTLDVVGAAGASNTQTFNGMTVSAGNNEVSATAGTGGSLTVNLGTINRSGGLVDFLLPASGNITTSDATLGGWATVNGSDYAKVVGGNIQAFTAADYTNEDNAATWAGGQYVTDTAGFFGIVGSSVQLAGLRYTQPVATTVTVADGQTLGIDGSILVAPSVGDNDQAITGGSITGGTGGVLGLVQNGSGNFTIGSQIVDNGGATGFVKGGAGSATLTGNNTYTGSTTVSLGTLSVSSIGNGGSASGIGASSADPSNLVIEGGVLQYTGGTATSDRGFTVVNGGTEAASIDVSNAASNLTLTGMVTSPDDGGFTKSGAGTLTLTNANNNYIGITTVSGGTLAVDTLANGGVASGIGASSNASGNVVLEDGGVLQYGGATTTSDRGFTVSPGVDAGGGGIGVSDAGSTLTLSGPATGAGSFTKTGAGTLVLTGTNDYTGGTVVNGGTLRAGSAQAFGNPTGLMTVGAAGTLDLGGFDTTVGGLAGSGTVTLGANNLIGGGAGGTFSGAITGTGGLVRNAGSTQTLSGCNSTYTGATNLQGGSISVNCLANGGQASAIGASTSDSSNLILNGASFTYTGTTVTTDRGFTLQAGTDTLSVSSAATTLTFGGHVTGAGLLAKAGAGTLVLAGNNDFSGSTTIQTGTLRAGSTSAFGTSGVHLGTTAGVTLDLAGFDNSVAWLIGSAANTTIMLGSAQLTLTTGGGSLAVPDVYAGLITGTGSLVKSGTLSQQLTGCNSTYTGPTTVNAGILGVSCLSDGGANSSIGASSALATNLVLNGGTLQYIGTGSSSDRQFTLGATGGTLDASGSGALQLTSTAAIALTGTNVAHALTLTGTNTGDNTLAALIADDGTGKTTLNKTGAGNWVLTNPDSTYTGITTISGGVLSVSKLADGGLASSMGASTGAAANLVIGNTSTLRYTGTGDTTDRLFTLAAGTTDIESSGTGAIQFTNTAPITLSGTNTARTIALGGSNTDNNTLGGAIANNGTGKTTLAKNDAGTWVLTGNNTYTGNTVINDGDLVVGNGGTTGNTGAGNVIVNAASSTLSVDRSDTFTFNGVLSGPGVLAQIGSGTTVLTTAGNAIGATTISGGTLDVTGDLTTPTISMSGNGALVVDGQVTGGSAAVISGGTGNNAITVNAGGNLWASGALGSGNDTVTVSGAFNTDTAGLALGAGNDTLMINDGAAITGAGISGGDGTDTLEVRDAAPVTLDAASFSGFEALDKQLGGVLTLSGDHVYSSGATIEAGTLQIGDGGASGTLGGDVTNNAALVFNRTGTLALAGLVSGTGTVTQTGTGTTVLSGNNSYAGATSVNAGTLIVDGDQSAATALTSVASGAALGGNGTVGGSVIVAAGAALNPGSDGHAAGTLTIKGDLSLANTSTLNYDFGQAGVVGGALNDLTDVKGNLTLDGTINVTTTPGGSFDPGVYRIISYGGTLTDNGLDVGTTPSPGYLVQTSVANQVNLINSSSLALNFWDGATSPRNDGIVGGGDGVWQNISGNNNWATEDGKINGPYNDGAFAVFEGAAGMVQVDDTLGQVSASGMQFATDGYNLTGQAIELTGATKSIIRVGDGTAQGAGYQATIANELTGNSRLVKTDFGTLVLSGANTYTGGTTVRGGTLSVSSDANLGDAVGNLELDGGTLQNTAAFTSARDVTLDAGGGMLATDADLSLSGAIDGAGSLTKSGTGTLLLTGTGTYTGGTTIGNGTLQLGNGGTSGSLVGDVVDNGALVADRSDTLTLDGQISGTGSFTQSGTGTTIMSGDNSYTGGTTISAGTLEVGNGGATGAIVGDVADNGLLVFNRTGTLGFDGLVSGSGGLTQSGAGTTVLTGDNTYTGATTVGTGTLVVNGNQSAATGATSVGNAATLGGTGTIGGNVTVDAGGAIDPGTVGAAPGTLTVLGNLSLSNGSLLKYNFGQAGVVGGPLNDLTDAKGNLVLDGTINVTASAGGSFDPGLYRIISYGGTLTDNTLDVGQMPSTGYFVQTAVAQQVNLVNTSGLTLNYWDGATGGENNNSIQGGDGTWLASNANDNWTTSDGSANAPFANGSYAIFSAAAGHVMVDDNPGQVTVSGMQFASDGYHLSGDAIELTGATAIIRVGDGTAQGTDYTATIDNVVSGNAQLVKSDLGKLVLTGANTYTGGTLVRGGTLSISSDANLGDAAGALALDGGTLETTSDFTSQRAVDLQGAGTFLTDAGTNLTLAGTVGGAGSLVKDGAGSLLLTSDVAPMGGTTIAAGTLQVGDGGTTGSLAGDVVDNGTLAFDRSDSVTFGGAISGAGSIEQSGVGTTVLTGANTYTGETTVSNGSLFVDGDQAAATGATLVATGGTLGGTGTIGGDVAVSSQATLSPGDPGTAPGTLTINGSLALDTGAVLNYRFGEAGVVGGALNDLTVVHGDLTLGGTLDVMQTTGGTFGAGVYRVFNYDGTLTDNGMTVGDMAAGTFLVQTAIGHQVNLVNTAGLTLNFWDGTSGIADDGAIQGGDGTWRLADNTSWTDSAGSVNASYSNGAFAVFQGAPGKVTVDNSNGQISANGMQFAVDGYTVDGDPIDLAGSVATIRVGDGTAAGTGMTATIDAVLSGQAGLDKTDLGTLVLNGNNSYLGGTTIDGGVLQVASDANLGDATGSLTLGSGTLHTTASFASQRAVALAGEGTVSTDDGTTLTLDGAISGAGGFTKAGSGTLVLDGAATHTGDTTVAAGTLRAGAANVFSAASAHTVAAGATLDLAGHSQTVASLSNAGMVNLAGAPGSTLTVNGNYTGTDGSTLLFNTTLGSDASATDRMVIGGDTSGHSDISVTNIGGSGVQTAEGIKLIDVAGTSAAQFSLRGNYVFQGDQAVVAGAYAYRLYQGGVSTPNDGDWYLRSALTSPSGTPPGQGTSGTQPLYQPGVPLYEAYAGALRVFNTIGTLYERVGARSWADGGSTNDHGNDGVWVRNDSSYTHYSPEVSSSGTDYDVSSTKMEVGADMTLADTGSGAWVGGASVNYGRLTSDVTSVEGRGRITSDGYGIGATLTWYGDNGLYVDGQARMGWYDTDLRSNTLGKDMADNNHSRGLALGVEVGRQFTYGDHWSLTPQAQYSHAHATYDGFIDPFGAQVSIDSDNSGTGRVGLSLDYRDQWSGVGGGRTMHLYGIANLYRGFGGSTGAVVADVPVDSRNESDWAGLGFGGAYDWAAGRYSIYGEVQASTGQTHFRDSHSVNGTLGFRMRW
jgi:fibronectin-binding autotransporter adhesin